MTRAALYARYSTELQNAGSIADQLAACRRHAERQGFEVVGTWSDAAISGASRIGRPGLAGLVEAARAGQFEVVVAEALDRLTRSGGDAWDLFDELAMAQVSIHTISEGAVEEMALTLKGGMNALFLKDLRAKVRRGLAGVTSAGRFPSRPPYGYVRRRVYDDRGEPIRGLLDIDEARAAIVRRIAGEILGGSSAHAVACRLNDEGVPGPAGRSWEVSAIAGNARLGRGILRNPIYDGRIVWNRTTRPKDRRTGKVHVRVNDEADLVIHAAPELRILAPGVFEALQAELDRRAAKAAAAGNASAANAPRRLLSGLVRCGVCGGGMHANGPGPSYRCLARMRKGLSACANATGANANKLEAQVLDALRTDLLHPDAVAAYVEEYRKLRNTAAARARADRATTERALRDTEAKAARLVDQVAEGHIGGKAVTDRLAALEADRSRLEAALRTANAGADIVALHPRAAERYRELVQDLQTHLAAKAAGPTPDTAAHEAAREALRQVVRSITIHPLGPPGQFTITLDGDLSALLSPATATRSAAQC